LQQHHGPDGEHRKKYRKQERHEENVGGLHAKDDDNDGRKTDQRIRILVFNGCQITPDFRALVRNIRT
jgi:hypothetical protein